MSSAAWTAIPQFTASIAYSVGQIVRPLTAPAVTAQCAFRCTTAGTASTEPAWPQGNNATVTTGGVTFTNVTGQSTYNWSAAAGNLNTMINSSVTDRVVVNDRVFLSSDHSESIGAATTWNTNNGAQAFGVTQFISVNRAGSVPPVAADALSGAVIGTASGSALTLEPNCSAYWQGITINSGANLNLANGSLKKHYFRNCTLVLLRTGNADKINALASVGVTLDNTTIQFNNSGQALSNSASAPVDFRWINTASAIQGSAVPSNLFQNSTGPPNTVTMSGVDLSALTTALLTFNACFSKILLDSCRIASGLNRSVTPSNTQEGSDEIELVNCFDGTNIISERHTPAGDVTTNRSTTMVAGAQDDVGLFSHQMVSSTRADAWTITLDGFWMDVEQSAVGSSHTATVEIISSASLNNTDISLQLEYLGTSGSSRASFASSLPSALTASAALPTSTATWNSPPATPVAQRIQVSFTPQQAGRLRGVVRLGKASTTIYVNPQITVT